jgi:hypothetical protein
VHSAWRTQSGHSPLSGGVLMNAAPQRWQVHEVLIRSMVVLSFLLVI